MEAEKLATWAIVELLGHKVLAGRVEEVTLAGQGFVRVDVPDVQGAQGFTKFVGPGSIYAITPTDEETARATARRLQSRPVDHYCVPQSSQLALEAGEVVDAAFDDQDEGYEDDEANSEDPF